MHLLYAAARRLKNNPRPSIKRHIRNGGRPLTLPAYLSSIMATSKPRHYASAGVPAGLAPSASISDEKDLDIEFNDPMRGIFVHTRNINFMLFSSNAQLRNKQSVF